MFLFAINKCPVSLISLASCYRFSRGLHGAGRHSRWVCPCRRTRVWRCPSTATPWCSLRPTRGLCRTQTKDTQTTSSAKMDNYGERVRGWWQYCRHHGKLVTVFYYLDNILSGWKPHSLWDPEIFFFLCTDWVLPITDFISHRMLLNQPMQTLVPTSSVTSQPSQCNMGISQTMWELFD